MTGDVSGDLTGQRLGNYRIENVLGRGGMSVMYKATDVRLGRKVALKVIGEHLGADAEFRERFVDEARNTSAIDHANIVPLYDFGELDGMLYIAMRLVDGSDLASLIGGSPMRPERAIGLLEQVADALDTLHERGLVHLDVKPANVLVTSRESAREHVYVADFGLTRRGTTGHRTRGGDFLGSPTYAAPEHLRGEPLDGRTDQYALACMLYACLTGAPPFSGDVQTVIKGHLTGDPPAVSRRVPSLPAAVDDVVRKGMAKNPDDRYGTCVALVSAAREALEAQSGAPVNTSARQAVPALGQPGAHRGQPGQPGPQGSPGPQHGEGTPVHPYGPQPGQAPGQVPGSPPGSPPAPPGQAMAPGFGRAGQPGPPPGYGQPPGPPSPPYGTAPYGMSGMQPGMPPGYGQPPGSPPPPGSGYGVPPKRGKAWLWWLIVGIVVVAAGVVTLIIVIGGDGEGGETTVPTPGSSAPDIPVGPGPGVTDPTEQGTGGNDLPPTSIPIVPNTGG